MEIKSAQQDMRSAFLRGSVGQAVSGAIWLTSAALGTWVNEHYAIIVLVLVGIFIFPLTQMTLRLLNHSAISGKSEESTTMDCPAAGIVTV